MTTTWHAPPWQEAPWTPEPGFWLVNPMNPTPPTFHQAHFTPQEMAELLDPPISVSQIKGLIQAAGLEPKGVRRHAPGHGPGRPARIYDLAPVMELHAALIPLLAKWGKLDD